MIGPELVARIRHLFYAEHWRIGTIASELGLHRDTVIRAVRSDPAPKPRPERRRLTDPYLPFLRETLERYPRLRATRLYEMLRERGYGGSVVQLRRVVRELRPIPREAFPSCGFFRASRARSTGRTSEKSPSDGPAAASPASC